MLVDKPILDTWRKLFLRNISLDAYAIASAWQFLNKANQSLDFDGRDYQKHISVIIPAVGVTPTDIVPVDTAIYYKDEITSPGVTQTNNPSIMNYNNFRTCIFLEDFIAPALLFPRAYLAEKESISDPLNVYKNIEYVYKNEKSLEINELLKLITSTIDSYATSNQEAEDNETITNLFDDPNNWKPASWDPLQSPWTPTSKPYMDDSLHTLVVEDIQKFLLIDGMFFDEGLAADLLSYWYNCFYSKATSTEVFDFLENEIPRFTQYFESAKPTPAASELFNLAVLYVKLFADKARSRGTLQLISERTISATRKMMRRLNFTTDDEKATNPANPTLTFPHDYRLIYFLTKGDSKLKDIYASIPDKIWDTVDPSGSNSGQNDKPPQPTPPINLNNLFPGDFLNGRLVSSFSNAYGNYLKLQERYEQYLKNIFEVKGMMIERNRISNLFPSTPPASGGVIY